RVVADCKLAVEPLELGRWLMRAVFGAAAESEREVEMESDIEGGRYADEDGDGDEDQRRARARAVEGVEQGDMSDRMGDRTGGGGDKHAERQRRADYGRQAGRSMELIRRDVMNGMLCYGLFCLCLDI
ncbi:hypothetical protein KEM56_004967, partial [Ascosphaera pollenicola]